MSETGLETAAMQEKGSELQTTELPPSTSSSENEESRSPRNWSPWKKRLLFCSLMSSSILCDGCVPILALPLLLLLLKNVTAQ
jgi:hypothetical protein